MSIKEITTTGHAKYKDIIKYDSDLCYFCQLQKLKGKVTQSGRVQH